MKSLFLLSLLVLTGQDTKSNHPLLRAQIANIALESKGVVGLGVKELETGDTIFFNGSRPFVLHSVFKLPIAMTYLHLVDEGKFSLSDSIHFTRDDMFKTFNSPLRDKYPKGNVSIPAREVIQSMVSFSDNCACDRLLKLIGGPKAVDQYMHTLGLKAISIQVSERQMAAQWPAQYRNWCTPQTMIDLLAIVSAGSALSKSSNDYLLQTMRETTTGQARIKALLPPGTIFAHKTGTSNTNAEHLSPATNDVGIITLPNHHHLAIAVFVGDSYAEMEVRESVIARIAKALWDEYSAP